MRLSAIEEFFYFDDRPAYPCSCKVRADFSGEIDFTGMESALRVTVQRYPRFCSAVTGEPPVWLPPGEDTKLQILTGEFPPDCLDLANGRGLAVRVFRSEAGPALEFLFHHACSDGIGFFNFLSEFLVAYGVACGSRQIAEPHRQLRASVRGQRPPGWRVACCVWALLLEWRTFLNKPAALVPNAPLAEDHRDTRTELTHFFSIAESASLRRAARQSGVSCNDLLTRDALVAIKEWSTQCVGDSRDPILRVVIPSGTRRSPTSFDSRANAVSLLFLDRKESSISESPSFLRGLSREIMRKRRLGSDDAFLFLLEVARLLPGGIRKHALAKKCLASVVVSNLGRVLRSCHLPRDSGRILVGNATLETISASGPLRPFQSVGFWFFNYANRWSVTMGYDPRVVSIEGANRIIKALVARVGDDRGQGFEASRQR